MKKIIGVYLLVQIAFKGLCFFVSLFSAESSLPAVIFISCGVILAAAGYVTLQIYKQRARLKMLTQFFVFFVVLTLCNILFMSFQAGEMIWSDMWVTGNLFEVLVGVIILFYLGRQKKYIRSKYTEEQPQEQEENEQQQAATQDDEREEITMQETLV